MWRLLLVLVLGSCQSARHPLVQVAAADLRLDRHRGVFLHGDEPFTGRSVQMGPLGAPVDETDLVHGRREGARVQRYNDGAISAVTMYRDGRREGVARTWWHDGTLRSEAHFVGDVAQGVQRQWFRSGSLFKEVNLVDGREVGLQRAWRENGAIYNNYEARDGRIYGLRRSKLCVQLEAGDVADAEWGEVPAALAAVTTEEPYAP
jgi:antitoxin component YwqK of YwqJK toxin-antitoxin module